MLAIRHNLHGFSLIELIIGLAIFGVLVSAAAPNINTWVQNRQLSSAAESISAGMQLARSEAVRHNAPVGFTLASTTSANWTVGCVTPVGDLDGDGMPDCPANIQSHQVSQNSPHAVIAADAANVVFTGLGRATVAAPLTIAITNPKGGACVAAGGPMRCLNVLVMQGGQVRMCDPHYSLSSNPQGCPP